MKIIKIFIFVFIFIESFLFSEDQQKETILSNVNQEKEIVENVQAHISDDERTKIALFNLSKNCGSKIYNQLSEVFINKVNEKKDFMLIPSDEVQKVIENQGDNIDYYKVGAELNSDYMVKIYGTNYIKPLATGTKVVDGVNIGNRKQITNIYLKVELYDVKNTRFLSYMQGDVPFLKESLNKFFNAFYNNYLKMLAKKIKQQTKQEAIKKKETKEIITENQYTEYKILFPFRKFTLIPFISAIGLGVAGYIFHYKITTYQTAANTALSEYTALGENASESEFNEAYSNYLDNINQANSLMKYRNTFIITAGITLTSAAFFYFFRYKKLIKIKLSMNYRTYKFELQYYF